jgi:DNA-directed RNA polymerase beta' subunit
MKLSIVDFEEGFDPSSVIANPVSEKNGVFFEDGLYSESVFGSMNGLDVEYRCKCRFMFGIHTDGMLCPKCSTTSQKCETVVSKRGWIDLEGVRLIHPAMYFFLETYIGPTRFKKYLYERQKIDLNGNVYFPFEDEEPSQKEPAPECISMGVDDFIDNLPLIMEIYKKFRGDDKKDVYDQIMANLDKIVITKIPIFSARLRPAMKVRDELIFDKTNVFYTQLLALSTETKKLSSDNTGFIKGPMQGRMQQTLVNLFSALADTIGKKEGFIRSNMMGSRMNWSARCVITPHKTDREIDEVFLPYRTAVELLRLQIISVLRKVHDMSFSEAERYIEHAQNTFKEDVYNIIEELRIKSGGHFHILLNRNPTIAIGSILYMRVTKIKRDITDLTMTISNNILLLVCGDYDGDVLNVFMLFNKHFHDHFKKFSPREFIVNPNDGKFNHALNFSKDHTLGLTTLLL